jgi:hypothetical protein
MGAVTALLYAAIDPKITCIIADSPFIKLRTLAVEMAQKAIGLPSFLIEPLVSIV